MANTDGPPITSYSAKAVEDVLEVLVSTIAGLSRTSSEMPQHVVRSLLQSAFDDMGMKKNRPLLKDRHRIEDHHYELLSKMVLDSWADNP